MVWQRKITALIITLDTIKVYDIEKIMANHVFSENLGFVKADHSISVTLINSKYTFYDIKLCFT